MPLPYFRHRSPYYYLYRAVLSRALSRESRYLAWAGLHRARPLSLVERQSRCLALAGVRIPLFFGKNLGAARPSPAKSWRRPHLDSARCPWIWSHMTTAEKKLWQAVRNDRLDGFHFRRQQVIHGFIADFY